MRGKFKVQAERQSEGKPSGLFKMLQCSTYLLAVANSEYLPEAFRAGIKVMYMVLPPPPIMAYAALFLNSEKSN